MTELSGNRHDDRLTRDIVLQRVRGDIVPGRGGPDTMYSVSTSAGEWGEEAKFFYRTRLTTELAVPTGSGAAHRMLLYRVFRFASVCK
jgi:hypothetical protein